MNKKVVTDQFAIGSAEAIFAYGAKVVPYETGCCEGFVEKSLRYNCIYRDDAVIGEEISDIREAKAQLLKLGEGLGAYERQWLVFPQSFRRSDYSPKILNHQAFFPLTQPSQGCNRCVPSFRTRYSYIHRIMTVPWLKDGVICVGLMGDGRYSGKFLVDVGIASHADIAAGERYHFAPCIVIPTLQSALEATRQYLKTLPERDQHYLLEGQYSD